MFLEWVDALGKSVFGLSVRAYQPSNKERSRGGRSIRLDGISVYSILLIMSLSVWLEDAQKKVRRDLSDKVTIECKTGM